MPLIGKVIIPAAGLGTRLLSATKEQPKEMLPLFAGDNGILCLKPTIQQIFEQLFDFGIRDFCFVVGRGKRAIEDHFTPDREYIRRFGSQHNNCLLQLESFQKRIEQSLIVWVNQPEPRGFGDAVTRTKGLIGADPFFVHAGDTLILSKTGNVHEKLTEAYFETAADAMLTLKMVPDSRQYGVAEVLEHEKGNILDVKTVVEKPARPKSKLAIMPVYIFGKTIFEALESTPPDRGGEIQLTDAIQILIDKGHEVKAIELFEDDIRLDIGTPETYWEALQLSWRRVFEPSSSCT